MTAAFLLREKGFHSAEISMGAEESRLKGILYAVPFTTFLTALYQLSLASRSVLLPVTRTGFYALLSFILAVSTVLHELLHGIGWAVLGKAGFGSITFCISKSLPSCSCRLILKKDSYLIGILLPFLALGSFSCLFLALCPGTVSMLFMLVNFTMAGTDLSLAIKVMKGGFLFIEGHPVKTGFIGYFL